jgi:peptide/nickel transport system substrate-binding protein
LAQNWQTPDKGLTWIFTLKDNLFWQDGTKVTASASMYSFEDVEVKAIDEKTLSFKLKNEFAPFPTVVSKPTFKRGLLGTGQWRVKNISLSGELVEQLEIQNTDEDTMVLNFYPTEERAQLAFKLGEVDIIKDSIDSKPFEKWSTVTIDQQANQKRFVAAFFNTQDTLLSDKRIRQALSYAIDKNSLGNLRALGPIPPSSWAYNQQVKPYDFDSDRALELIDEFKEDSSNKVALDIKLVTSPLLLEKAEKVALDWQNVGFKTTVQVSSILPEDFQVFLVMYDAPSDPDQYSLWHSTQFDTNITHYRNERVDTLLENARAEVDFEARKKMYLDFQRFLLEDAPAAFLYHPVSYTVTRK